MNVRARFEYFVYPAVMGFSIAGARWGLAHGYSVGVWVFIVTVVNLTAIGLLEQVLPLRPETSLFRDRQSWNAIFEYLEIFPHRRRRHLRRLAWSRPSRMKHGTHHERQREFNYPPPENAGHTSLQASRGGSAWNLR